MFSNIRAIEKTRLISQKIVSPKWEIILTKMNIKLFPLYVQFPLFIVNIYFERYVYMFSNGRDMTKCQFLHNNDNADNPKAIAIPRVFSENSRANNRPKSYTVPIYVVIDSVVD